MPEPELEGGRRTTHVAVIAEVDGAVGLTNIRPQFWAQPKTAWRSAKRVMAQGSP